MRFVDQSELARRSEAELDGLLLTFNMALARRTPFSKDWNEARASVDKILTERKRRANAPVPF